MEEGEPGDLEEAERRLLVGDGDAHPGEAHGDGDEEARADDAPPPAEESPEPAVEETPMDVHVSVFPSLAADTHVDYVSLPTSLQIDAHEFIEERLRRKLLDPADYLEPAAKVAHDHPWRCVRWRTKVGMDGHYYEQSNARVVTWSDGTQHLFIGDSVVYELTKQPMRRGLNEAYNLQEDTGVASHCAPLDTKLVFRLVKEPTDLKARQSDKKQRKVKMVEGVSAREEERVLAEEEKRKAQGALARARAKKEESAARVELDSNFLEEGLQDFDGAGGEGSTRTKRPRGQVDEARLLEAKRKLDAADAADADDGDAMELEDDDDGSGRDDDEGPQDDLQLFDD